MPRTALTLPSKYHPIADFSEVASACISTIIIDNSFSNFLSNESTVLKGQSILIKSPIKILPQRFITAIFMSSLINTK